MRRLALSFALASFASTSVGITSMIGSEGAIGGAGSSLGVRSAERSASRSSAAL